MLTCVSFYDYPINSVSYLLSTTVFLKLCILSDRVAFATVVIAMKQMRELEFLPEGDIELDNILLLIAETGVYIFTSFTIVGGLFANSVRIFFGYTVYSTEQDVPYILSFSLHFMLDCIILSQVS